MKFRVMLGGMGLLAATVSFAQMGPPPAPVPPARDASKSPAPATKKDDASSAAAKKAPAPTPAPAPKKEAPPAEVEGLAIARANGGFLGLKTVNNNFLLTFYDAKKQKVAPDVARAAFRWVVNYQPGPERTVLNPGGDSFSLTSPKVVRPPLTFKLFISLLVEGKDDAVESYTVDYHGE